MAPPVSIRDLGKSGIIKDRAPYDLPINAWSGGANVLFYNNRVISGPVYRNTTDVASIDGYDPPVIFSIATETAGGFDPILFATSDFHCYSFVNGLLTDISPVLAPSTTEQRFTTTNLGGVTYINRPDLIPHYYDALVPIMQPLPAWNADWRCVALRSYKDFLVALNVTKIGIEYASMVKWSNTTLSGSTPPDWDETDLSSLAGENVLTDATTGLIDGGPLKNDFVIYSRNEVFLMEFIGAPLVFSFRKVTGDDGAIAQNCWVEISGKHVVFGSQDIYMHDGMTIKSLADGRVRRYIFDNLDRERESQCFVFHSKALNTVFFCYPSTQSEARFPGTAYCNVAAGWNYVNDTWTFLDVPNITSSCFANIDTTLTYADAQSLGYLYSDTGGTFADQETSKIRHLFLTSVKGVDSGVSQTRLLGMDDPANTHLAKPSVAELLSDAYIERTGMALEALNFTLDSRKYLATLYPLVVGSPGAEGFSVSFARSDFPDGPVTTETAVTFEPATQYKVNTRDTGRFLGMRFDFPTEGGFYLSGYDLEVKRVSLR